MQVTPEKQGRHEQMFQVRFHGRGGQGVVTAAELLAAAAFAEGRHAQAFPSFGSERMGAPVTAFCRIDDRAIRTHEPVMEPDALIIQDSTLLHSEDLFAGLSKDGCLLINTVKDFAGLGLADITARLPDDRHLVVPATQMALTHLGRPLPGAPMLAGFAALTGVVSLDSVIAALRERFRGKVAEGNVEAAREAYEFVRAEREAVLRHA
jgi:pyruvate ferredoxin oxidoreductase gamma subunit